MPVQQLLVHRGHCLFADARVRRAVGRQDPGVGRGLVHGQTVLLGHQPGQVDGEALRGVQVAHERVRQLALARRRGPLHLLLHLEQAPPQGAPKRGLLGHGQLVDHAGSLLQLGERLAHGLHHAGADLVKERLLKAQQLAVADGAPHDPPQHVLPAALFREHAVGDAERGGPGVVRHHAQAHVLLGIVAVAQASQLGGEQDVRQHQVSLVGRGLALLDRHQPLEAHAGVHPGGGQRRQLARRVAVELHEDQVPDLHPAVALAGHAQALLLRAGQVFALQVVQLRAGAAGAGLAHGPKVVGLAQPQDPIRGEPDVAVPGIERLLVSGHLALALEDGGHKALGVQLQLTGQELPGVSDGLGLEVVAEGEVAQHLEEGVVPRRAAHVLQVIVFAADPQALLRAGGGLVAAALLAGEHVLELHHAGVGEVERGIVGRDQRRAAHDLVSVAREVVQKQLSDGVGIHGGPIYSKGG